MRIVQSFHNTSHRFCPHKRVIGPGRRCPQCEEASCINTDHSGPAVQTTVRVGSGCLEEAPQGGRFEKNSGVAEDSEVTDKEVVTALKTALDHSSTLWALPLQRSQAPLRQQGIRIANTLTLTKSWPD